MESSIERQVDEREMKTAIDNLSFADRQNHELSIKSRKILADFYNKMLFYSVGAFSFGTTLIGLVVSNKTEALSRSGILFPNIFWLYFSLISFFLTSVLVMFSKKFDSKYLGAFGMEKYAEKLRDKESMMIKMIKKYPQGFVFTKGSTSKIEKQTASENLGMATDSFLENSKKRKSAYRAMRILHVTSEIFVTFASLFMLIFVIQFAEVIVWG